ncbi:MAG: AbrB/MazE/SpoVT family DNA-binding domain-containing protein [Candidatus Methanoperedenaceae archaeon]|nr:AbrB/MazE/SpoVT family DNA-binding domain-containing protein [Candidatus Methanoperedenaceae archaeon]
MSKAIEGSDGCIRTVIPSDLCDSYNIKDGDEILFFVNGKGIDAEKGDLIISVDHRGGKS